MRSGINAKPCKGDLMKIFETPNIRIEVQDHLIKAHENKGYCIIQGATGRLYLPFEELGIFIDELLNIKLGLTEYKENDQGVHKIEIKETP